MDLTVHANVIYHHDGRSIDYTCTLAVEELNGYSPDIADDLTRRATQGVQALINDTIDAPSEETS